jgi:predicted CopG family antitoxin
MPMAVKTITIDMEAYEKLAREKRKGESFSQVIKRVLGTRGMTASDLLKRIEKVTLSDDTLDRIEEVVRDRERDLVQAPDLSVE